MANSNSNHSSSHHKNKLHKQNSTTSHLSSMSDTESQVDSFHSPLRTDSPHRSDDPFPLDGVGDNHFSTKSLSSNRAMVSFDKDKYYSPLRSPHHKPYSENSSVSYPPTPTLPSEHGRNKDRSTPPPLSPRFHLSRAVREDVTPGVTKVSPGRGDVETGRQPPRMTSGVRSTVVKAALGFRICEFVLCLISFSVMAADKTEGWSGDSFDRYKEYRYCVAVNVIGFAYSGFQACTLVYNLASSKHPSSGGMRYFDFSMDQILAYLIMSASSSAATRVDDWISNWGSDEFTKMATASVGVSFLAFIAFAFSSLISGYTLCNRNSS